jgi:hypothetical protein
MKSALPGSVDKAPTRTGRRTAPQAGYLATVQEALSGHRWGRVLNQARPPSTASATNGLGGRRPASIRVPLLDGHTARFCDNGRRLLRDFHDPEAWFDRYRRGGQ